MAEFTATVMETARDAISSPAGTRSKRLEKSRAATTPRPALLKPQIVAGLLAAVAALTLMVSLKHLADGLKRITQSGAVEAWACAVIFD